MKHFVFLCAPALALLGCASFPDIDWLPNQGGGAHKPPAGGSWCKDASTPDAPQPQDAAAPGQSFLHRVYNSYPSAVAEAPDLGTYAALSILEDTTINGAPLKKVDGPGTDVALVLLDANGNVTRTRVYGGPANDFATDIESDSRGRVYLGGTFSQSIQFGRSVSLISDQQTIKEGYIAKLDSYGQGIWGQRCSYSPPSADLLIQKLAVPRDDRGVVLNGRITGDITCAGTTLTSAGNFFYRFDHRGNLLWSTTVDSNEACTGLAFDTKGNLYAMLRFALFVFDANGQEILSRQFPENQFWSFMDADPAGNLFVDGVGAFQDSPMQPWPNSNFLARLTPMGDTVWLRRGGFANLVGELAVRGNRIFINAGPDATSQLVVRSTVDGSEIPFPSATPIEPAGSAIRSIAPDAVGGASVGGEFLLPSEHSAFVGHYFP